MNFFLAIFLNEQFADPQGYPALHIVGSIQAIQTIVSEDSFLALNHLIAFDLIAIET